MSLGEAWPTERARLEVLLERYREAGDPGRFALAILEDVARRADEAWKSQDVARCLQLFAEMRGCQ